MRLYDPAARAGIHTISITPGYQKAPGGSAPTEWFRKVMDNRGAFDWEPITFTFAYNPAVDGGAIEVPDALGAWMVENGHGRKKPWSEKVLFTMEQPATTARFRANHDIEAA